MKKTILLSVILFFIAGAFSLYINKYDISADAGKNPTVLIDREGYLPGEEKKCFFLRDAADKNESDVFYVVDKKRINRFSLRKNILVEKYGCPKNMTEKQFCENNGWYRI